MSQQPDPHRPSAGGAVIAGAVFIGFVAGVATHEPTVGVLAGIGIGSLAALLLWLRDRRR